MIYIHIINSLVQVECRGHSLCIIHTLTHIVLFHKLVIDNVTCSLVCMGKFFQHSFSIYFSLCATIFRRVDMESDNFTPRQATTSKDVLSITLTGFALDDIYQFRVAAVNEFGVTGEFDDGVIAEIERGKRITKTSQKYVYS